uniref:Uncharacterized protein n=1 Tax=Arion vulgaris TaxID=1028688 RepID=A0A0B6Y9Y1_9EUPU
MRQQANKRKHQTTICLSQHTTNKMVVIHCMYAQNEQETSHIIIEVDIKGQEKQIVRP